MKPLISLFLCITISIANGQSAAVERLKDISNMPYICRGEIGNLSCGQEEFWKVVEYKLEAIPYLLDKLDDTTRTVANVPNFGGYWTVADIAFNAIEEIIDGIPTFELLGVPFDSEGCGYCSYWIHLKTSIENRDKFKVAVTKWFAKNKDNLVWVTDNKTLTCDCSFDHPNNGHYELKSKTGVNQN